MPDTAATGRYRRLPRGWHIFSRVLLIGIPVLWFLWVLNVHVYLRIALMVEQFLGLVFALAFGAIFLLVPESKHAPRNRLPWYDIILAFLSMASGVYVMLFFIEQSTHPVVNPINVVLGCVAIIVTLEATRRLIGWMVVAIGIAAVFVVIWGYQLDIHSMPSSTQKWVWFLYLDNSSLFGTALNVITIVVQGYLLFGYLLSATGGAEALIDLAMSFFGKYTGGPAKIAVVSSAMFGTMSGSPSANVAVTGAVTIPLMKRTGFSPEFAGAVEAAASTGGLLLPPVMGVAAFLMAQFLGIPYGKVAIAAFLPAVLYYLCTFSQVHLRAVSTGLKGLPPEKLPDKIASLRGCIPILVPMAAIVYPLFVWLASAEKAALYGIYGVLAVALINRKALTNLRKLPRALEDTGLAFLDLAAIGAIAGLVVGCLLLTGLGLKLGLMLLSITGGGLWLLLALVALVALIMGMGMPIIVIYILLAILVAPAIIQAGVPPLAAHLFILWWGATSFVTPPICGAVFVARAIAQSDFLKTAVLSCRLAIGMYVIPFVFIARNGLLMTGSVLGIVYSFLTCAVGLVALAMAFEGYGWAKLTWPERVVTAVGGIGLLVPAVALNAMGGGVFAVLIALQWIRQRKQLFLIEKTKYSP